MASSSVAAEPTWPELLGSNNWKGLLDPLDLPLRKLILRCGDFCQATYDAFNNDQNSKYCGSSRYGKPSFFNKVMLENAADYKVSAFLYATARVSVPEAFLLHSMSREAWDRESNWIGYIAVTTDEVSKALGRREIYVAWRGTCRNYEWVNVLDAGLESSESLLRAKKVSKIFGFKNHSSSSGDDNEDDDDKAPKVMKGWLTIYTSNDPKSEFTKTSVRTQLLSKLKDLLTLYKDENPSVVFVGHSLGATLSVVSAFDLAENVAPPNVPVAAFVFGSPQVGNDAFKAGLSKHQNLKVLHVRNEIDMIPHYPGRLLGYRYVGTELVIDTRKSTNLKDTKNPSDWHNLQAMLHVVAGWNGEKGEFSLKVKRSLALVNKSAEILKAEYLVPGSWWVEKNKGMVLGEDGEWALAAPDEEDMPVPEHD